MWSVWCARATSSRNACTCASLETSARKVVMRVPREAFASHSAFVWDMVSCDTSHMAMWAPSALSCSASSRPIPVPPPVITAIFPWKLFTWHLLNRHRRSPGRSGMRFARTTLQRRQRRDVLPCDFSSLTASAPPRWIARRGRLGDLPAQYFQHYRTVFPFALGKRVFRARGRQGGESGGSAMESAKEGWRSKERPRIHGSTARVARSELAAGEAERRGTEGLLDGVGKPRARGYAAGSRRARAWGILAMRRHQPRQPPPSTPPRPRGFVW